MSYHVAWVESMHWFYLISTYIIKQINNGNLTCASGVICINDTMILQGTITPANQLVHVVDVCMQYHQSIQYN